MILRPSRTRALGKTFLWVFVLVCVYSGINSYLGHNRWRWTEIIPMACFGGCFLGGFASLFFTPKEIEWDDDGIRISRVFPGSGEHRWDDLVSWSRYVSHGVALLKFNGRQSYQISPSGFRTEEWRQFREYLQTHFPERKTSLWIGPIPVRFKRR